MAGEWIKVRTNLWNDPRVAQVCEIIDQGEATVIGGMYWLWATADEHTEDGFMPGLSCAGIDRKTGIKGFGNALVTVGWISANADGVTITRFNEHNGASAKSRAQTARRVAEHKTGKNQAYPSVSGEKSPSNGALNHGEVTHESQKGNAATVTNALPREEKNKNKDKDSASAPTLPRMAFDIKSELSVRGVDEKTINGWLEHRKKKRSVVNEVVLAAHIAEADKARIPLSRALAYAVNAGWQAFNADWYLNRENKAPAPPSDQLAIPRRERVL